MKTYKQKDINDNFKNIVNIAKQKWIQICKDNLEKYGDEGSCVIGAAIKILFIPKGCRKSRYSTIISSDEVSQCQGSLNWERGVEEIIQYLKENNIDSIYSYGRID
jgi:hypothetical protein